MRICAAWLLKHVAVTRTISSEKPSVFMSGRWSLTPILHSLGPGSLARTPFSTFTATTLLPPLGATQQNVLWRMRRNWSRTRLKLCSPWVGINIGCCLITGLAKTTFKQVSKMLPSSSEVPFALGAVTRREGHWDQSIAYFEQALALDPRNANLLMTAAWTYGMLRQFPMALKFYDRALDIMPNDQHVMASKASIYQAQGNLQEAARFLSGINEQTPNDETFAIEINQLRLERNYGEAIRLLQGRLAQFRFDSEYSKAAAQVGLAIIQRLAGDTAGAKLTAEQARNTLEQLYKDQPDNSSLVVLLSQAYAAMGEKESAMKEARRAIMLLPSAKDRVNGPGCEENLALIQVTFGENSRAISTLTHLLQTPYISWLYDRPVTPALLRLDPFWDPLRGDPAFQKLCEEKQPLKTRITRILTNNAWIRRASEN